MWAVAACGTDVGREAGALEVTVTSLPEGVDRVRIDLTGEEIEGYRAELSATQRDLTHVIPSVPARDVQVSVIASAGGVVEGRADRSISVAPDIRNRVVIDLGTRAGTVVSDPIPLSLSGTPGDVAQGQLELRAPLGPAWAGFVSRARSELGGTPDVFEVRSVDVRVLSSSREVEELDEIWEDGLTVTLASTAGSAEAAIASGALFEDRASQRIPLAAGATNLSALTAELLSGEMELVLFGPSKPSDDEPFTAWIEVTLIVAALDT